MCTAVVRRDCDLVIGAGHSIEEVYVGVLVHIALLKQEVLNSDFVTEYHKLPSRANPLEFEDVEVDAVDVDQAILDGLVVGSQVGGMLPRI